MPSSSDSHAAHDNAERIRERLPRRLQELRERAGLSRSSIGKLERGVANPTVPVTAQPSHGIGMSLTLTEFMVVKGAAFDAVNLNP